MENQSYLINQNVGLMNQIPTESNSSYTRLALKIKLLRKKQCLQKKLPVSFFYLFIPQKIKRPKMPPNTFKKISYHVKKRLGKKYWYISSPAPIMPVIVPLRK